MTDDSLTKPPTTNSAINLIRGLSNRELGSVRNNVLTKEDLQLFAEEELVRKPDLKEMRCEMPGMPRSTFLMVFSPDGRRVASTHGNHNIYVSDLRSGKNIKTLVGHPRTPWCIAFHPTLDQIVASGCLGGQVRIWDLSGGSEVWTTATQTVIASMAFHPNDRMLVFATGNHVYFWDWRKPEPFVHTSTSNAKEKVRYVSFDKLGHKLITGIVNSVQTRWERVRAPVLVPRQEPSSNPYRRRITQRLVTSAAPAASDSGIPPPRPASPCPPIDDVPENGVPERERRITNCFRNMVREYELLFHRYLQLYRPPTMIDRGTDPMEPSHFHSGTQTANETHHTAIPGPSGLQNRAATSSNSSEPSTSTSTGHQQEQPSFTSTSSHSQSLITPSMILSMGRKPASSIRGTQTSSDSRKHKSEEPGPSGSNEKRFKRNNSGVISTDTDESSRETPSGSGNADDQRVLVINLERLSPERMPTPSTSSQPDDAVPGATSCAEHSKPMFGSYFDTVKPPGEPGPSGVSGNNQAERFTEYIRANSQRISDFRRSTQEVYDRAMANARAQQHRQRCTRGAGTSSSTLTNHPAVPPDAGEASGSDSPRHIQRAISRIRRTAEEEVRNRILPIIRSVPPQERSELIRLFENSRVHVRMRFRQMCPLFLRRHCRRNLRINSSTDSSSSDNDATGRQPARVNRRHAPPSPPRGPPQSPPPPSSDRHLDVELEQLVASLLTELEWHERSSSVSAPIENTSARTRPNMMPMTTPTPSTSSDSNVPPPPGQSIETLMSTDPPPRTRPVNRRFPGIHMGVSPSFDPNYSPPGNPNLEPRMSVYGSNPCPTHRRRFFSHRVSAFMPTRVNYTRMRFRRNPHYPWGSGRSGLHRVPRTPSLILDELINAHQEQFEEDPALLLSQQPFDPAAPENPETVLYSNIVQNLEYSLNDVVNITSSSRPGDSASILSNFNGRLENIMEQSDTILRNLRNTLEQLPNVVESSSSSTSNNARRDGSDPWRFNEFYVRDRHDTLEGLNAVSRDHTYPRNPTTSAESLSPLMSSLQFSISHIQQQARLLRVQVESIDRINRSMVEMTQLQLIRQMVVEIVRYIQNSSSGTTRNSSGMSSMREMMAGTRISDSNPYEPVNLQPGSSRPSQPCPSSSSSSSTTSGNDQATPASAPGNRRTSNRKTYPPSRFVRMGRQYHHPRRQPLLHWFSRRYVNRFDRSVRQSPLSRGPQARTSHVPPTPSFSEVGNANLSNLFLMANRLELLLNTQTEIFTHVRPPPTSRSENSVNLGEHILALRLHGCLIRLNRVLGTQRMESGRLRDTSSAVTQDGVSRYYARYILTLVVDSISRYLEELGTGTLTNVMRMQLHGILAMALLLIELLMAQIVEDLPSPTDTSFDPERDTLARRIDEMCVYMLQNRVNASSIELTRCLRLMRLTMQHARRALHRTYVARRNAMLPNEDMDRRELLNYINRCLRTLNSGSSRQPSQIDPETSEPIPSTYSPGTQGDMERFSSETFNRTAQDVLARYSEGRNSDPGPSMFRTNGNDSSNNENSDEEEPEEPDFFYYRRHNRNAVMGNNASTSSVRNSILYQPEMPNRLAPSAHAPGTPTNRSNWNIPAVQVNDVPVSEPGVFTQRLMAHRQRVAERVSELRANPRVGLFRPRFLHPLYANLNPFDADLDDPQRENIYDTDMVTTVTPNHRIQVWDVSDFTVPSISNPMQNVVVNECKIHNDASVDVAVDGSILVTLLPSGGYLNVTNRLGVYSLRWETLGQCLYTVSFEQNAVSVSLSPLSRHLVVGFVSRRVSIMPRENWVMARIYKIEQKDVPGYRLPMLRELEQSRESRINCIKWLPSSGEGLIYATNTGQLIILSTAVLERTIVAVELKSSALIVLRTICDCMHRF